MQSLTKLFTNHKYVQLGWHTENISTVHSPGNKLHHGNCYIIMASGMQSLTKLFTNHKYTFNLDGTEKMFHQFIVQAIN